MVFETDVVESAHNVFHSPTSVAFNTPLKGGDTTDIKATRRLGSAKRLLPNSRNGEKSIPLKSSTPQPVRRRKDQEHYMKTTEASRYLLNNRLIRQYADCRTVVPPSRLI